MIKKVIHISDIHIPNDCTERPYNKMIVQFLKELYADIKDFNKEELRIVIAGDTFQQKIKTSNEAKEMFHELLNYLNAISKTIIYAGNHDLLENNRDRKDSITPTFAIKNVYKNITFIDKMLEYKSGIVVDDDVVWVLYSIFDKYKQPEMMGLREQYPNHKIIGLYHGNIPGATTDVGATIDNGVNVDIFNDCDCVMAGHIHKYQTIKHNGVPIVYAGSLFQQNVGENVTGHGYVLWDLETMSYEHKNVSNDNRIFKFKLSSYDDVANDEERLINL